MQYTRLALLHRNHYYMAIKQQEYARAIGSSRISIFHDTSDDQLNDSTLLTPLPEHFTFDSLVNYFKHYQPKSGLIDAEDLNQAENLKLKKYKAAAYYGQFVNGKRHGVGVMLYNNRTYEGQWESDFKHGKGFELYNNQSIYTGSYVNGKPEGLGRFQWPNGQFYEGQWLSGCRHGSGMWNGAKGDSYVGQWKFGKADGFGVHVWVNGDRYEGYFKQSLKHGQGTEKFISGDLYKGAFYEGKPSGYGEYFWADGSFYKGDFKNGFREGNGVWKKSSGDSDKYEGHYVRDKKQGYGIFSWASGNIYKGHYREDLRDGYGQMFWNDGSYYKGEWRKGYQEGEGAFYTEQSGLQKGRFQQNQLVQLYDSLQEVNEFVSKKRKKKRTNMIGNIAFSVKLTDRSHSLIKEQPKLIAKIPDSSYRSKYSHSFQTSTLMNMNRYKKQQPQAFTTRFNRKRHLHLQNQRLEEIKQDIKQDRKQYNPHSSLMLKTIEQRVGTVLAAPKNQRAKRANLSSQLKPQPTKLQQYKQRIRNASTIL